MDDEHIGRLIREQDRSCQDTYRKIAQWEAFKSDYGALKARLGTLPDEVTHDVMVPFGTLAFMPGQLVHTNEILALLGENWFVERSAKQATEIVDRRIKSVESQLEDLHKELRLLEPRRGFTSDLQAMAQGSGEMQDIREEYDEEKESHWRDDHRQRVQQHRREMKEARAGSPRTGGKHHGATSEGAGPMGEGAGPTGEGADMTDEHLWARLDELEIIEADRRELQEDGPAYEGGQTSTSELPTDSVKDTVHVIADESYSASDELDSDDDCDDAERDVVATSENILHFSHTNVKGPPSSAPSGDPAPGPITSPGDIYPAFLATIQPASILKPSPGGGTRVSRMKKKKRTVAFKSDGTKEQVPKNRAHPQKQTAFTDRVVEKCPAEATDTVDTGESSDVQAPDHKATSQFAKQAQSVHKTEQQNKPVSRFRARRQNVDQT